MAFVVWPTEVFPIIMEGKTPVSSDSGVLSPNRVSKPQS